MKKVSYRVEFKAEAVKQMIEFGAMVISAI
jgi:hypothetical protein